MNVQQISQPKILWTIALVMAATGIAGTTLAYSWSQWGSIAQTPEPVETAPVARKITALGRLEPEGEAIRIGAPATLQTDRVAELLVDEGDRVEAGQVIAILDSRDRLQAALEQAEEDVRVALARLEQVKAGAKSGDIAAQAATIDRLKAQRHGDQAAQIATINRLQAQWETEKAAQIATINRIQAQWETEKAAQIATLDRIQAQWEGDREAQIATLGRLNAELKNAEAEYQRYRQLSAEGAISQSLFDSKSLVVETSRQQVAEAQANLDRIDRTAREQVAEAQANLDRIDRTAREQVIEEQANLERIQQTGSEQISEATSQLDSIAEVRPVDVQVAQSEVDRAMAAVNQAQTDLEQTYVKAPKSGQVLKIHTHPGERLSENGIIELGKTSQMLAIAEVYQTDIGQIRVGQPARITSQAFDGQLTGTVSHIGLQVKRQNVFSNMPGENLDRRVIEVKIRLTPEDSEKVSSLTNLQVEVAIEKKAEG
ncbi:MAG TPA: ABC exporter membrane fusion protein [Oscillatoriales cyanobacterium M59_W2019_021]|nr:ABC exporter membrane fusion protein [Oscillatoriales cyanobacterium M59_W2019_021]